MKRRKIENSQLATFQKQKTKLKENAHTTMKNVQNERERERERKGN
jgi:hypothetical protein